MENVPDDEEVELDKGHAKYLLSAVNYLMGNSSNSLRSHWNILLSDIMRMKKLTQSKKKNEKINCMYCMTPWKNGLFSVKVIPKPKRGKKMKRLIKKINEQKELSKYQRKLAAVMHSGPTVVVNCKICHKSSKFKIPHETTPINVKSPMQVLTPEQKCEMKKTEKKKIKKKRKLLKKKKEKAYSGLNPYAVQQVHGSNKTKQNGNDDDDVVMIEDDDDAVKIIDHKPKKRKMDDDIVKGILDPGLGEVVKTSKEKGAVPQDPLPITPLGLKNKNNVRKTKRSDVILPLESDSTPRRSEKLNDSLHKKDMQKWSNEKGGNPMHNERQSKTSKRKSLKKWKMLIADEETKPIKTSSLQDFLSTL